MPRPELHLAYLHGFASSPDAFKAKELARRFSNRGRVLIRPDLNLPSFSRLTFSGALVALDRMHAAAQLKAGSDKTVRWQMIGSSLGGYLAARWAQLHGERVDRLLLLCPALDFVERWAARYGASCGDSTTPLARWEQEGSLEFPDAEGVPTRVGFELVRDARRHPPFPEPTCPTRIVHGLRDEQVPIELSYAFAATRSSTEVFEADDDHSLSASLDLIEAHAAEHFGWIETASPEDTVDTLTPITPLR